jgi:cardiolipin synthase C
MIWQLGIALAGVALLAAIASALALRSWNRFAARARGPATQSLPIGGPETALDALLAPLEAAHPGQSGLANLLQPERAFAARCMATRAAGRSLDIITYIWSNDTTGRLLMAEILAAADRGVRVRLLLDDVNVQGFDLAFLGLNQHPMIEVRLFNPVRNRGHWLRRGLEFLLGLSRFNRRMHGKVWIADSRLAILGGRNVGDGYFGMGDRGARLMQDADMILVGPKLGEVTTIFDTYWNLGLSLPIVTLWPSFRFNIRRHASRLARHNRSARSQRYRARALNGQNAQGLLADPLRWTDEVTVLADPPEKTVGLHKGVWLSDTIGTLLQTARHSVMLTTPYFVPGGEGMAIFAAMRARGVTISVLTNALAVTDLPSVHAAYASYRAAMLRLGARLFEYAPPRRALGQKRDMLHSKIFVIDDERAIVGSHNFDLRSAHTNIELGLLFRHPDLVAELAALFHAQTDPKTAYAVSIDGNALGWSVMENGHAQRNGPEPGASLRRRIEAWVIARVPHDLF